jgi:methylthioribose-1-phosphate isomerase
MREAVEKTAAHLATSRPTAVNLFWALDRMKKTAKGGSSDTPEAFAERLAAEAVLIAKEDTAMCRAIGEHGANLLAGVKTVITHIEQEAKGWVNEPY